MNFQSPLEEHELLNTKLYAVSSTVRYELPLYVMEKSDVASKKVLPLAATLNEHRTIHHTPIFILGAARSGTSAVARALLDTNEYVGFEEGHLIEILAPLFVAVNDFYRLKGDDATPERNTMLSCVPQKYIQSAIKNLIGNLTLELNCKPKWIEKTPNSNMIHLAPIIKSIWPKAKFIFLKRRAIENLASRRRKFKDVKILQHFEEWAECMRAWTLTRHQLGGAAIEVEQLYIKRDPLRVSAVLSQFLQLEAVPAQLLTQSLQTEFPQRTSGLDQPLSTIDDLRLNFDERKMFDVICGAMMSEFHYTYDETYTTSDFSELGIVHF